MAVGGANEVGRSLIAEIREETFDALLHSLQSGSGYFAQRPENRRWLGLSTLDRICNVFAGQPQKSTRPPVVEISSVEPAAGKTHLLYLLAAIAVLPACGSGSSTSGLKAPGTVVVFDADGRFDIDRMAHIMRHILRNSFAEDATSAQDEIPEIVFSALKHVHILRPQSLDALVASTQDLYSYLFAAGEHSSSNRPLNLILIDSISAFFWQDKLDEETLHLEAETAPAPRRTGSLAYTTLAEELREVQEIFGCSIVVTTLGLIPAPRRKSGQAVSFRPLLPVAWQNFYTVRLVVSREAIKRFPPETGIEEATVDAQARQAVVDKGKFSAWVDEWGSDAWSDDIWRAVKAASENSRFTFQITDQAVHCE